MWLFIGALVLNLMVFFDEIEASGLRRISTMPYQNDLQEIDHYVTSRLPTQSSSTYNNHPSLEHQALDLGGQQFHDQQSFYPQMHGYHPQESFQQESHGYYPHLQGLQAHQALDSGGYQSNSPQTFHELSHGHHSYSEVPSRQLDPAEVSPLVKKFRFVGGRVPNLKSYKWLLRKNYGKQPVDSHENIEWLREQKREFELELLYQEAMEKEMEQMNMRSGEMVQMPSMRDYRHLNWQGGRELSQEGKPKKQRAVRIQEPASSQNSIEESAMNEPANREIGHRGKGKAASRKDASGSRGKGKASGQKNVSNSHDQQSQQSQHSDHDFDEFEPTLIPSHMSHYNPYLEFLPNDPNQPNQWGHLGGSGSGSHQ